MVSLPIDHRLIHGSNPKLQQTYSPRPQISLPFAGANIKLINEVRVDDVDLARIDPDDGSILFVQLHDLPCVPSTLDHIVIETRTRTSMQLISDPGKRRRGSSTSDRCLYTVCNTQRGLQLLGEEKSDPISAHKRRLRIHEKGGRDERMVQGHGNPTSPRDCLCIGVDKLQDVLGPCPSGSSESQHTWINDAWKKREASLVHTRLYTLSMRCVLDRHTLRRLIDTEQK